MEVKTDTEYQSAQRGGAVREGAADAIVRNADVPRECVAKCWFAALKVSSPRP